MVYASDLACEYLYTKHCSLEVLSIPCLKVINLGIYSRNYMYSQTTKLAARLRVYSGPNKVFRISFQYLNQIYSVICSSQLPFTQQNNNPKLRYTRFLAQNRALAAAICASFTPFSFYFCRPDVCATTRFQSPPEHAKQRAAEPSRRWGGYGRQRSGDRRGAAPAAQPAGVAVSRHESGDAKGPRPELHAHTQRRTRARRILAVPVQRGLSLHALRL